MSAACPDIPIVVLPENNMVRGRTRPAAPVRGALTAATDALMRLHGELLNPAGADDAARKAMDTAVEETDRLAVEAMVVPMNAAALKPIVPNHEYFGVRTAPLDDARLVSEVTTIIARTLRDLRNARLDLNDQAYEIHAMAKILEGLVPPDGAVTQPDWSPAEDQTPYVPGNDELTRWVITHHFYFVLNLAAADAVSRAATGLADGDRDTAFDAIQESIAYVRGFTAAMMHSGDMSAPCYDAKVRPTMQPPAVPTALTGRTQPEHKAFRKAMRNLVTVSPQSFAEMMATDPDLALARDALLEADLQDIERHISVTAALVGDDRSIVQGETSAVSAVSVLRTMRHSRAELYRELMRSGDPVTLIGA
ncbi:hypothetical protein [Streptosporangium sp. NPDC006007]|uniref:hypothetical protein n=1 Tax=Streptosporangium sp. NPDC006007 TaxID=3154575 RepID=UPI0033B100DD